MRHTLSTTTRGLAVLLCILLSAHIQCAFSALTLSNTLGSNMVLQRAPAQAVLWGWDTPNAKITVEFGNFINSTVCKADGSFSLSLIATNAGGPYSIVIISSTGGNVTLSNILFGDVYLCSGQSNMQYSVAGVFNASAEIALAAKYPQIRLFSVGDGDTSDKPVNQLISTDLKWSVASPQNVGYNVWTYFSAVCWFYGKELADANPGLPVGLISTNWGGTYIQAWSSPDALKQCGKSADAVSPRKIAPQHAQTFGVTAGPAPNTPSVLWNAMIVPFLPMQVKGALWYQGENNAGDPNGYACMFPAMIKDWRAKFGQTLPFFFVQLSPWSVSGPDLNIPLTRIAQLKALSLPNVGFATAADLGDISAPEGSIHPRNKQEVSRRLFLQARAITYGDKLVVYKGPMYEASRVISQPPSAHVVVSFAADTISGGLKIVGTGNCPVAVDQCAWAQLWLSDNKGYNATIEISGGNALSFTVANAPSNLTVKYVSYGHASWPMLSLYNGAGLPAIPFYQLVI